MCRVVLRPPSFLTRERAMTLLPGQSCWAVRLSPEEDEDWTPYTLGETVGNKGGTAQVYRITAKTAPPLLAKIYHSDSLLERIAKDPAYAQRLMHLGEARSSLARELPFCAWPRRIVFRKRQPQESEIAGSIIGLTLPELSTHRSLLEIVNDGTARTGMTHGRGIHLAISLADQLHRLHTHPWQFVIGDLSPNNILVDYSFSSIHFIDMDAVGFAPVGYDVVFDTPGSTPCYRSPEYFNGNGQARLSAAHDDFVLAVVLFQLLMAMSGVSGAHPFLDADACEDEKIRRCSFPYVEALRGQLVADTPANAYAGWHADLRAAFEGVFTGRTRMTAKEWVDLLSRFRRSLR